MEKKILTEQSIYYGNVSMPIHWDIDRIELSHHILHSSLTNQEIQFSRTWDKLNTYIKEHINLKHKLNLVNKKTWGNIYNPLQVSSPLLNVDPGRRPDINQILSKILNLIFILFVKIIL